MQMRPTARLKGVPLTKRRPNSPLEEDDLKTEGWAHGGEDGVGSGLAGVVFEGVFEDVED